MRLHGKKAKKQSGKNVTYIKQHRVGALVTGFALGGLAAGLWYGFGRKKAPRETIDERYRREHPVEASREEEQGTEQWAGGNGRGDRAGVPGVDPLPPNKPF